MAVIHAMQPSSLTLHEYAYCDVGTQPPLLLGTLAALNLYGMITQECSNNFIILDGSADEGC